MSITLENVTKRYGGGQVVVDRVSLDVQTGELFVLLGASGSGKSTILRMLAGLTAPDDGTIRFADRDVTRVPPQKRDVGLVFQNYSIFRHMTVGENIEFGLRIRGAPGRRARAAARGAARAGRPRRARGALRQPALGRSAPARRPRARARLQARRAAARRAVRRARRQDPRAAAPEPEGDPEDPGRDDRPRDARPGGGVRARPAHRRHGARPAARGQHAGAAVRAAALALRGDLPRGRHGPRRPLSGTPGHAGESEPSDPRRGPARRGRPRARARSAPSRSG